MRERRETIRRLLDARGQMNFQYELQAGQLPQVDRELAAYGSIDSADALALLDRNEDELLRYLYYTSARCIRRLEEPKYNDLMSIVHSPDTDKERVTQFNKYISEPENLKKLLRVFPHCGHDLHLRPPSGRPGAELLTWSSWTRPASAARPCLFVPILRGASLMLVGDPQQLACHSAGPRRQPHAAPPLRCHAGVRLHRKLDLQMLSGLRRRQRRDAVELPLSVQPPRSSSSTIANTTTTSCTLPAARPTHTARLCGRAQRHHRRENTAPQEVRRIEAYLTAHPDKQVGIITPFAKQRAAIEAMLRAKHF